MSDDSRPTGVDPSETSAAGRSGRCRRGWDTMTDETTNSHGSEAQNENETVEDRLLGAFDVATVGVRADALVIEANPDYNNRVGEVTIPTGGVLLLGNIDDGTTVYEALDLHDWQVGTAESTEDGTAVTVWEAGTEEGR